MSERNKNMVAYENSLTISDFVKFMKDAKAKYITKSLVYTEDGLELTFEVGKKNKKLIELNKYWKIK